MNVKVLDFRGTYKGGGGPDKTILNSAAQHDKRIVHVIVAYLRRPDDDEFHIGDKAKELKIDYIEFIDRSTIDWRLLLVLKDVIQKRQVDLVHSHDDKTLLYSVILKYLLLPGLKIVHTCHSHSDYKRSTFCSISSYYKYILRKKFLVWLMGRHKLPVMTVSENTRHRLISGGLTSTSVEVLHNGIDTDYWDRSRGQSILREELKVADNCKIVGMVARITHDKDLPTFYEVARKVVAFNASVIFVIVGDGDGSELADARRCVAIEGLDKVIKFTGHREDLIDVYSSLDVFLMTSLTEGMPNTVLEAMALKVPVVSTSVGGVPELVVDGVTGYLLPKGDSDGLAKSVLQLLENDDERKRLGIASRERIENKFSFSKRVRKLEKYYVNYARSANI